MTPTFTADTFVGDRSAEVYSRLLKERIVFLGSDVNDTSANLICAQLLLLQSEDPDRDIYLYINSPGGSVSAGMAIYDTMQYVSCDVGTICLGLAASMGQFLLSAGTPGKRYALPHSRVLVHQPAGASEGGVGWDPRRGTIDAPALEGHDAVVNLAGASIGGHRWTDDYKATIRDS